MPDTPEQAVVNVNGEAAGKESPRVEIIRDGLCSLSELRRAVVAGAITSCVMGALAGVGLGYWLGLQDRRK
jgi:integral membrane sensor domain MASE1